MSLSKPRKGKSESGQKGNDFTVKEKKYEQQYTQECVNTIPPNEGLPQLPHPHVQHKGDVAPQYGATQPVFQTYRQEDSHTYAHRLRAQP